MTEWFEPYHHVCEKYNVVTECTVHLIITKPPTPELYILPRNPYSSLLIAERKLKIAPQKIQIRQFFGFLPQKSPSPPLSEEYRPMLETADIQTATLW